MREKIYPSSMNINSNKNHSYNLLKISHMPSICMLAVLLFVISQQSCKVDTIFSHFRNKDSKAQKVKFLKR